MSNPITTAAFRKALQPGINAWYGQAYDEWSLEYPEIFDTYPAKYQTEEDVLFSGFGLLPVKTEASGIHYDTAEQGFSEQYKQVTYSLGFQVTREMLEDNLYSLIEKRARALAFSVRQTKEILGATVLNTGFDATVTYGDGVTLFSTAHPFQAGGTWANKATVDADLSETAIENALIDIDQFTDDRGLNVSIMGQKLIVPSALRYEAERILESTLQNNSANNAVNALKSTGVLPMGYVVNHYLTDTDAWFIKTNAMDGFKQFVKREDSFEDDNSFSNDVLLYKASFRTVFGVSDKRAVYGSSGA